MWKEAVLANLRYYLNIYLQRLRKPTEYISQNNQCPHEDMGKWRYSFTHT
jgi:hypothetical protein